MLRLDRILLERDWRAECSASHSGEVSTGGRNVVVRPEDEEVVVDAGRGGAPRKSRKACEFRWDASLLVRMLRR